MVSFAAISGVCATGCPYPATFAPQRCAPARTSMPPHAEVACAIPAQPLPICRVQLPPQTANKNNAQQNRWKPKVQPRPWKKIIIHHTATSQGSVPSIHAAHLRRKDKNGKNWLGIGYHFVIGNGNGMRDGAIEATFRWRTQLHGSHAGNWEINQTGIGIALVGNFEKTKPTPAQLAAIKRLVATLKKEYKIASKNVLPHNRVRATACPGKLFPLAEVSRAELPKTVLASQTPSINQP